MKMSKNLKIILYIASVLIVVCLVLLYKKSRRMSTRNVEVWQTAGNDDAIDSLSQILPY